LNLYVLDACALLAVLAKEKGADNLLNTMKQMPVTINDILTDDILKEAGRLKSKYKLSLADSIAIAETIVKKGSLVTADHHEIEPIETAEKINVTWFR